MKQTWSSKLDNWRNKYGALAVAFGCMISVINSWGQNGILTSILILGVFVCGTIGYFDVRRTMKVKHSRG